MKGALKFAVIGEALTGLALLIVPVLVGQLLLGLELRGAAIPAARVVGIALIGLSVACLPGLALAGMLTYGVLVMLYLGYLGIASDFALTERSTRLRNAPARQAGAWMQNLWDAFKTRRPLLFYQPLLYSRFARDTCATTVGEAAVPAAPKVLDSP